MPPTGESSADRRMLCTLWKWIGLFGFAVALTTILRTMDEQSPKDDPLKLGALGPYTITLYATPILAIITMGTSWLGVRYAKLASRDSVLHRIPIPWTIDGLEQSSLRSLVAVGSLCVCLIIPLVGTSVSVSKFFHGTYYRWTENRFDCKGYNDKKIASCDPQGSGWYHFFPSGGIGNPLSTHYVFEGNKDYIPVLEPLFFCALVAGAYFMAGRYLFALIPQKQNQISGK